MLEQAELHLVTDEQWEEKILKRNGAILTLQFWNRLKAKDEALSMWLSIFDPEPDYPLHTGGGISLQRLPDALVVEPILTAMLKAMITTMGPAMAEIGRAFRVMPSIDKATLNNAELDVIRRNGHDQRRPDYADWRELAKKVDGGFDTPLWRFWIAQGEDWPKPGWFWLEAWQSEPADEVEPFLGGTLYTWHKYAPWNLPDDAGWKR
jgi:hypothetical protein